MGTKPRGGVTVQIAFAGVQFLSPEQRDARRRAIEQLLDGEGASADAMPLVELGDPFPVYRVTPGGMCAMVRGRFLLRIAEAPQKHLEDAAQEGGFVPREKLGAVTGESMRPGGDAWEHLESAAREVLAERDPRVLDGVSNPPSGGGGAGSRGRGPRKPMGLSGFESHAAATALQTLAESANLAAIPSSVLAGIGGTSLMSFGIGQGLDRLFGAMMAGWQVEDSDSTGEQLAHHAVQQIMSKLKSELQSKIMSTLLSKGQESMSDRIDEFFGGPGSGPEMGALRLGDIDTKGNAVTAGAATVECEGRPLARLGDPVSGKGIEVLLGSGTVLTEGKATARLDTWDKEGKFTDVSTTVFVGGPWQGKLPTDLSSLSPAEREARKERARREAAARATAHAYGPPEGQGDPYGERVQLNPGERRLDHLTVDNRDTTGYTGFTYEMMVEGEPTIIVVHQGSDQGIPVLPTNADGTTNLSHVYEVPEQYREAAEYLKEIQQRFPGYPILNAGHSLGGGLAAYSGMMNGIRTYAFDAAGMQIPSYIALMNSNAFANQYFVTQINAAHDPITHGVFGMIAGRPWTTLDNVFEVDLNYPEHGSPAEGIWSTLSGQLGSLANLLDPLNIGHHQMLDLYEAIRGGAAFVPR